MALPSLDDYLFATLATCPKTAPFSIHDLMEPVAAYLHLTADDLAVTLSSGGSKHKNQIRWSLVFLTMARLLLRVRRGLYQITPDGVHYLSGHHALTRKDLQQFPEYRLWIKSSNKNEEKEHDDSGMTKKNDARDMTPEESIDNAMATINAALASELLEAVRHNSPQFFEQLVVDLMLAMGYGGSAEDAGKAFKTTCDGGIDGIIKEDRLGLSSIYLQAKRWENTVGRPDIQAFAGALMGRHATRGVFITTSKFSKEALEYARLLSQTSLVLIDGEKLVQLMIEYNVGVSVYKTYKVKRLDSDYFNEDA